MMKYDKSIEWKLWLRALLPSFASLTIGLAITAFFILFHLLLIANNSEFVITEIAGTPVDSRLSNFYADKVQQPLDEAFGNDTLGLLSTAIVWGFIGWVIYTAFEFIGGSIYILWSSTKEINTPLKNKIVKHPLRGQLLSRLLWRFLIGLLMVIWTAALQPYISDLFRSHLGLLTADGNIQVAIRALIIVLNWLVILHVYAILMRLFVFRTRFFGEIIR